jgi:hypothetical protein
MFFAGCADTILTTEEERVIGPQAGSALFITNRTNEANALGRAAIKADQLASAYFAAGVKASRLQSAVTAGVTLAAGSVAIGALGSASDRALTNRAFAGVGLQTLGQNGVPKTKVEAIFKAAKQMNCIAGIADIYSGAKNSKVKDTSAAENLTYAAMQDVRISARNAFVGEVQSFSTALQAFTDVVQTNEVDLTENGGEQQKSNATVTELESYATKLGKCLEAEKKK